MVITYFHRNPKAGYSINKVIQTIVRGFDNKREFYVPYMGGGPLTIIKNIFYVWKNRDRYGINHITGDILYCAIGLIGCKSILTIHDTVILDFQKNSWIKYQYLKWLWLKIPMKLATKIICISEDTRERLYKLTKRRDLIVIHNAVDPIFKDFPKAIFPDVPNILLIGTSENKNLMRTFESLKDINCHLTIVGKLQKEQSLYLNDNCFNYENKVGLNDEEIVDEYVKSDIVSFISLFEGFGMIVIEANKVGRPVICSDINVLHEVGGNAALYVDPLSVQSMREGFKTIISDENLRSTLVANGYENVKRFDAENIRKQWLAVYEELKD